MFSSISLHWSLRKAFLSHLKRSWCWERLGTGGERVDRRWGGWMASPTQWTWVWVDSKSWWWTGRPGVLRSMGSQSQTRLSDWTELNWRRRGRWHQVSNVTRGAARQSGGLGGGGGCRLDALHWRVPGVHRAGGSGDREAMVWRPPQGLCGARRVGPGESGYLWNNRSEKPSLGEWEGGWEGHRGAPPEGCEGWAPWGTRA